MPAGSSLFVLVEPPHGGQAGDVEGDGEAVGDVVGVGAGEGGQTAQSGCSLFGFPETTHGGQAYPVPDEPDPDPLPVEPPLLPDPPDGGNGLVVIVDPEPFAGGVTGFSLEFEPELDFGNWPSFWL